ncbi:uncharacterized protein LOC110270988 [Arachis ipaensis]|uniref:uncharacterized protein LOC110270988 n=1 Tax=Arachis ipaensis TaxID=130454 RepID=UPI000A2B600E|nr:uncharacterized protein LOC110270988 [Arachis ipaensis]
MRKWRRELGLILLHPLDLTGEGSGDGGGCWCWVSTATAAGRFELLRRLCRRRTSLPSLEDSSVDPPELLAAAGVVLGPVQNPSCFVLLFRAVYAASKMCGAVL